MHFSSLSSLLQYFPARQEVICIWHDSLFNNPFDVLVGEATLIQTSFSLSAGTRCLTNLPAVRGMANYCVQPLLMIPQIDLL